MRYSVVANAEEVEILTPEEADKLLREGIPLNDLDKYVKTVLGTNESFWEHLQFLEDQGIVEVEGGLLKMTV